MYSKSYHIFWLFVSNKSDPHTLYLLHTMKQTRNEQFLKVIQDEINIHTENRVWVVIKESEFPEGA